MNIMNNFASESELRRTQKKSFMSSIHTILSLDNLESGATASSHLRLEKLQFRSVNMTIIFTLFLGLATYMYLFLVFILLSQLSQFSVRDRRNRNITKVILTEEVPRVHVNSHRDGSKNEKTKHVLPEKGLSDSVQCWGHLTRSGVSVPTMGQAV